MVQRIFVFLSLFAVNACAFAYDWSTNPGDGGPNNPYQISEPNQLIAINDLDTSGLYFVMTNDIDLDPNLPGNQVFDEAVIAEMHGVFDGSDYAISNLTIEVNELITGCGLLEIIGELGTVQNLHIENVSITSLSYKPNTGALAAVNHGIIINCHSSGTLRDGQNTGGLIGISGSEDGSGLVANCSSSCRLTGLNIAYAGGLIGLNRGSVYQCFSTGRIEGNPGWITIGGLISENKGVVNQCYSNTQLHALLGSGLIFANSGSIRNCYTANDVLDFGNNIAAGLTLGNIHDLQNPHRFARIENCYAACQFSNGGYGLVGDFGIPDFGATLTSFWDAELSGETESYGGRGLTTAQMKDPNTYINAGWDFSGETNNGEEDIWQIDPNINGGYPMLVFKPIDGGDGSAGNPYIIYTKQQLLDFLNTPAMWDKHIKLIANIDLSDEVFTLIPIDRFNGVFDGSGCKIIGLRNIQLIDVIGRSGIVKNLTIEDADITDGDAILASSNLGQIKDCHFTGTVNGTDIVGGIVVVNDGLVFRCSVNGDVNGLLEVGGLIGENGFNGIIQESYCDGSVFSTNYAGGLVCRNHGLVEHSYCDASVEGNYATGFIVCFNSYGAVLCVPGHYSLDVTYDGGLTASIYSGNENDLAFWEGNSWYQEDGHIWVTPEFYPGALFFKWQRWGEPVTAQRYGMVPSYRMDSSRDGSPEHPYIFTFELADYPADWDKCFIVGDDLDCAMMGCSDMHSPVIPYFNGTFDGNGHVFENIVFNSLDLYPLTGFFGMLGPDAHVKQFGLEGEIDSWYRYPGLMAANNKGTIEECYVKGTVACPSYGGLLTGINGGTIRNCYTEGSLILWQELTAYDDGIVGSGLYARNWGRVLNSYSAVTIEMLYEDFLFDGLNEGLVWNSFYNADLTEPNIVLGGKPLTSEQMKSTSSFVGWGDNIWKIADGNDMPRLAWENTDWTWTPDNPEPPECWLDDSCPEYLPIVDVPRSYGGGNGTAESPYVLSTPEHLLTLGKHLSDSDKHFILGNDIDFSGHTLDESVIGYFTGHFNGAGHSIHDLAINGIDRSAPRSGTLYSGIGLFGCIDTGGLLENLAIDNANINGECMVGALSGENNGTIRQCRATGTVTSRGLTGGLVGSNGFRRPYGSANIENCYVNASVFGENLQGFAPKYLGGIVGANNGQIQTCYTVGSTEADDIIWEYGSFITGAITGWGHGGPIENTYYLNGTEIYGQNLSAVQMKQRTSFNNWDFVGDDNGNRDVWRMCVDGMEFPRLSWEFSGAGDYACPAGVDLRDFAALAANWLTNEDAEPET
ncbi:MAG: hypothetical protein ACYSUT_05740, partial [Planctomycetota bacterium]